MNLDSLRRTFTTPRWRRTWHQVSRVAPWLLAAVVTTLVVRHAATIDWAAVRAALAALPWPLLAGAAAIALAGHAAFASYDLVARQVVGHRAAAPRSALIAAIGYALNLNFGALVGGVAVRLRLYDRAGVPLPQGSAVVACGMAANWSGWALLMGGVLLVAAPLPWPERWAVPPDAWRWALAGVLVLVPALGLLGCARRAGQPLWRSASLRWPALRHGASWLVLATLSWSLAATVVWVLLRGAVPWWSVAGAMLLAAVAGVVTHVPAGLGVLEAVVLSTLGSAAPQPTLLAALVAYRLVYYGVPLLLALAGYAWLEAAGTHSDAGRNGEQGSQRPARVPSRAPAGAGAEGGGR